MYYKAKISYYLQSRLDTGLTQAQLAGRLGFNNSNVISMHLDPSNAISPFPVKRLPALAAECGLDDRQCLALLNQRAIDHPDSPTQLDQATLHFVMRCSVGAVHAFRSRTAAGTGAVHAQ